jgi:hypothetical protein
MNKHESKPDQNGYLQKINKTINVAMHMHDENYNNNRNSLKLSLDVENVNLDEEERDQIHPSSPVKNKQYPGKSIHSK